MNRLLSLGLFFLSCCLHMAVIAAEPALAFTDHVYEHNADPFAQHEFLRIQRLPNAKRIALKTDRDDLIQDNPAQLAFEADWTALQNERPAQRRLGRTAAELGLLLVGGTGWYWANQNFNQADWDLDPTLDSLWQKIKGDAVRFDTNNFGTNVFNHPFTGAGYYTVARSNGYSAVESFLFTLAASTVWEYFIEYLELVSLNDQAFSPVGGTVIGEVFYQLGEFFTTSADNRANGILKWVFGAGQNFHRWWDDTPAPRAKSMDRFGFRDDIWHQFELLTGFGAAAGRFISEIGLETQIISLPGYGTRQGDVSSYANGTIFTQMRVGATFGKVGLQDISLFMKAMFLGYFRQSLTPAPDLTVNGYSFFIGPASAYELNHHEWQETGINDFYGILNILGPSMDLAYYRNALRLRLTMALYGDFAAIRAFAIDAFKEVGSLASAKSILLGEDYYFALGLTTRTQVTLTYEQLELGTSGRYSYYNSIEGLDRYEENITDDVRTTDEIASVRAWLAYKIVNDLIKVGFSYERRWRSGTASNGTVKASESETENRFLGSLLFLF